MSLLRVGVKAPHLPKRRRPSGREKNPEFSVSDVDEYNNRQLMRCVATRNAYQDVDSDRVGPPGMKYATTVQRVEAAQRELLPVELAAWMAREHGTQEHQNLLVDRVEEDVRRVAGREHWRYHTRAGQPDPVRLLASIVVEEWLNPAKYWKLKKSVNGDMCIRPVTSAFARVMRCKRDTWYSNWQSRFMEFQGYPQTWYEIGKMEVDGVL